jgi:CSLREA domain-containing protein
MSTRTYLATVIGLYVLVLALAPDARSATLTVNDTADDIGAGGTCTLREAIEAANVNANIGRGCVNVGAFGDDTVVLTDPAGYALSRGRVPATPDDNLEGDLDVNSFATGDSLEIVATVPTAIRGNGIDRVLDVLAGSQLSVRGITITTGRAEYGGGIRVLAGGAAVSLTDVTLTDNHASSSVGGAISSQGTTTLTNVTVSHNTSITDGGAIAVSNAVTTLNSVTLSDNTADIDGDGLGSGGGVDAFGGEIRMRDTLLAGNIDRSAPPYAPDCLQSGGVITSLGNNLVGSTAGCAYAAAAGDRLDQAPLVGPLAANGGATPTHALLAGSPAIDGGSSVCPAADQRGIARPQGSGCDIGAFERVPDSVSVPGNPTAKPKRKCKRKRKAGKRASAAGKRKRCKKKRRKGGGRR